MPRPVASFLAAFASLILSAQAADSARWETWDGCRFEPEKYFDGDSFHVRHGRESVILRLYFVDAPETDATYAGRVAEQAAYFRAANASVLRGGEAAKQFTAKFLARPFRVVTCRHVAPGASRAERYYAIVESGGRRLDAALVEAGLARVTSEIAAYPDEATGRRAFEQLRTLEQAAARARRGLWVSAGARDQPLTDALKPRMGQDAPAGAGPKINLNTATQAEIESLPGIGPKTAQQIIRARPLEDIEALDALPGIGPKTIERLRDLVSF